MKQMITKRFGKIVDRVTQKAEKEDAAKAATQFMNNLKDASRDLEEAGANLEVLRKLKQNKKLHSKQVGEAIAEQL